MKAQVRDLGLRLCRRFYRVQAVFFWGFFRPSTGWRPDGRRGGAIRLSKVLAASAWDDEVPD
jgi:hypothetical protein